MRVYVAGPMSGREAYNFPAFDAARDRLMAFADVTTPADITREKWQQRHGRAFDPYADQCEYGSQILCDLFALDLIAVCAADVIALLPGWENSKGARLEIAVAKQLGKRFMCAESMTPLGFDVAVVINNEISGNA